MVRGMLGFNQEIMDMCVEAGSRSKSDRIYLHIGIVLGLEFAHNFIENRQKMADERYSKICSYAKVTYNWC